MEWPTSRTAVPEFSIVVPAYNASDTIDACLDALLHQSIDAARYEIIVVDDGSTDDTKDRAAAHGVRVLSQANAGPASARNAGAREARGALLLFTDADCEPTRDWLASMIAPFADPQVMAAKGSYKTRQRSLTARFAQLEFEERYTLLSRHASIDMIDTYAAAFRTEAFRALGGFDPSFPMANNEDTDLSYRLAATGARMVFARPAIVYHHHPDSLARYIRIKYWRGYWRMVVYKRHKEKLLADTYTPQTLKIQAALVAVAAVGIPLGLVHLAAGQAAVAGGLGLAILTALPFAARSWRLDPLAAFLSPAFLLARAGAIGSGAVAGVLSGRR